MAKGKTHYVYRMYDVTEDKYYGGVRTCPTGVAPEDDDYMGSSKLVKEKIEAGNEFVKMVVAVYSTRQEANEGEHRYLEKHKAAQSENWYNQFNSYPNFFSDWTGRKHTEESKRKISKSKKGVPPSEKQQAGWERQKGRKLSKKTKFRMRLAHINRPPITEETRNKISEGRKGKKHTEESKRKIGKSKKGIPPSEKAKRQLIKLHESNIGRKHTEESKIKMSESTKGTKFSEEHKKKLSEIAKNRKIDRCKKTGRFLPKK